MASCTQLLYGILSTTELLSSVSTCMYTGTTLIRTHLEKIISMATWHIVRARKLGRRCRWCVHQRGILIRMDTVCAACTSVNYNSQLSAKFQPKWLHGRLNRSWSDIWPPYHCLPVYIYMYMYM